MRAKHRGPRAGLTLLTVLLALSGCASEARTDGMTVAAAPAPVDGPAAALRGTMLVATVTGGADTNPFWQSNVSTQNFRAALAQSLTLHGMIAADQGRYLVNAELVSLDRPFAAFDTTVTARVHYAVVDAATETVKFDATVETPYTVNFSDTPFGPERVRLANEGAIRENIAAFLQRLIAAAQPGGPLSV